MKYISIIVVLFAGMFLFSCDHEISESQSDTFLKMYGAKGLDAAKGIAILSNGGYAICGTETSGQESKMILILTDEYGNMKDGFPKYYPESDLSAGANAIVAKNGGNNGFLLSGYIEDETGDKDIYIVKTSADGTFIWDKTYGSVEDEEALHATEAIEPTDEESIRAEFVLSGYQEKDGEKDMMVMAVNQDGDSILDLFYNKPPGTKDASVNYILNDGDRYLCVASYNKFVGGGTDITILNFKDDLSPNPKIIEGIYDDFGKCIVKKGDEEFVVVGNSANSLTGNTEILLYLVETSGPLVSSYELLATISELGSDLIAERLVETEAGKYVMVGTRSVDGEDDIFIQFLEDDQVGERKILGATGDQSGADIGVHPDGKLVILGENGYEGNSVITLIKTNEAGHY